MIAPDNSIYEVLLCQKFHHACGGYHDPALNAFVYRPKLLSEGLLTPLVVLDGTGEHSRGNEWEPSSNVTIEEIDPSYPAIVVEVENITPNPSLLDDGDVEPNPGPINLSQHPGEPRQDGPWIQWFKKHWGDKRDGPDGWFNQYQKRFDNTYERKGILYRNDIAILNPMDRFLRAQKRAPSRRPGIRHSPEQDEPESVYVAPPAVFSHYDDSHMWWVNTHISPVPDDIVQTLRQEQEHAEYVAQNDLLAWHLYDVVGNPAVSELVENSQVLPVRTGPYKDMLEDLHSHFLWNGGHLMLRISSLTGQYWSHHLVIKKGAPKLRHLKTRVRNIPLLFLSTLDTHLAGIRTSMFFKNIRVMDFHLSH